MADTYPLPSKMQPVQFEIDPAGQMTQQDVHPVHKFSSVDENWAVYLSTSFITLETSKYSDRADMLGRFKAALSALAGVADIPSISRVGFRYVNRISEPADYADIEALVTPAVLGTHLIPLPDNVERQHSITQALFVAPQGSLTTKWAFLPGSSSHDPTIEPVLLPSWILDLDAFDDTKLEFEISAVVARIQQLAALAYSFFRWSVKDEFLTRFGGMK